MHEIFRRLAIGSRAALRNVLSRRAQRGSSHAALVFTWRGDGGLPSRRIYFDVKNQEMDKF